MPSTSCAKKKRELVDAKSCMQKNRPQMKKLEFCGEARPTYFCGPAMGTAVQALNVQSHCALE
eukprot:5989654-Pyramimonas_sp.AAC.1